MDNKILVIAGMHRSGTSLISQWLHRCGLNLGNSLLGAGIGNMEGHFEDMDFLHFHEDTLMENNASRYGFVRETITQLTNYQRQKLKGVIGFKSALSKQWGWKEPRTCLFLDCYRELIPEAYYLVIIRDYKATVSSLVQRDFKNLETKYLARNWFSRQAWALIRRDRRREKFYRSQCEFYLNVWITYNEAILKNLQILPASQFIVTDHNLLHELDTKVFDRLVNKWDFLLDYTAFNKVYKEKLISDVVDIDQYIENKDLIEKARNLEVEIRKYI